MEANAYTVIKKLEMREYIKLLAGKLFGNLGKIKRSGVTSKKKSDEVIKTLNEFKTVKRQYKNFGELNIIEELSKCNNTVLNKLGELEEMIVDIRKVVYPEGKAKNLDVKPKTYSKFSKYNNTNDVRKSTKKSMCSSTEDLQ